MYALKNIHRTWNWIRTIYHRNMYTSDFKNKDILLELRIGFAHIPRGSELSAWDFPEKKKNVLLKLGIGFAHISRGSEFSAWDFQKKLHCWNLKLLNISRSS